MAIAWKKLAFDSEVVKHSLATAENDFLVAPASGSFVKKTLAETQAILGLGNYLPLAGGTMQGNIVMPDGGTIGQSDGPLLTFDDSKNALKLTGGSLGINTTTTSAPLVIEAHATSYTYGAYIGRTVTQPTSGLYGMSVNVRDVATSDHSGASYGMIFGVYVGAADGSDSKNRTGSQYGVQGFTWHNGTGTCNAMYGGYFGVRTSKAGGTISNALSLYVNGGNAVAATIANYFGLRIGETNTGGTITTDYGIYIDSLTGTNRYAIRIADQSGGSVNYAIYTGAGMVRIGGEFGCNGAMPRAAATLTGSAAATYDTTTRNLINAIATALKNNGICQ